MKTVDDYVNKFGEHYRKLIEDSLNWLANTEPSWKLDSSIDRDDFLNDLIGRVRSSHYLE